MSANDMVAVGAGLTLNGVQVAELEIDDADLIVAEDGYAFLEVVYAFKMNDTVREFLSSRKIVEAGVILVNQELLNSMSEGDTDAERQDD